MRVYFVIGLVVLLAGSLAQADRGAVRVQQTRDLQADARLAQARDLPLLIMFSSDGCPYCIQVTEEFLEPMLISGQYEDKVLIRMVKVDEYRALRDFDGEAVTADELAARYNARLVPTVVFVDAKGDKLAPSLVGITTPDFYGGYLDEAIETSLDRLRRDGAAPGRS